MTRRLFVEAPAKGQTRECKHPTRTRHARNVYTIDIYVHIEKLLMISVFSQLISSP